MQALQSVLPRLRFVPVDDVVMGGRSASQVLRLGGGAFAFRGAVSFENNGGFCSTRADAPLDLRGFAALEFVCVGDGKTYKLNVRIAQQRCLHQFTFATVCGLEQVVHVPLASLRPHFKGKPAPEYAFDPASVDAVGFTIARQEGPFELRILSLYFVH